jgi:hypothetical protein
MSLPPAFTIGVLLYGDYPELAARCLSPRLLALLPRADIRVAMNACGQNTVRYAEGLVQAGKITSLTKNVENRCKYPVLRDMLYGADAIQSPYLMWFDDDSCLVDNGQSPHDWLTGVEQLMEKHVLIGSRYTRRFMGNQHLWVAAQPWYREHPPVVQRYRSSFMTGGWWVAQTEMLRRFNWPQPELKHNGGDQILGCIIEQQGLPSCHFNQGVWINASKAGEESGALRRGVNDPPLGTDYIPPTVRQVPRPRLDPFAE